MRIVIADDNASIRRAIRSHLQNKSTWEICGEAEDGKAAVERVRELTPEGVILDLSMPGMSGLEAARRIKAISPATRIVLFTAHDSPVLRVLAEKSGIKAVVAKDGGSSLEAVLRALNADEPLAA